MTRKYKTLGKDLIDMELILESSGQLGLLWATPVRPVRGTGQTGAAQTRANCSYHQSEQLGI
jgi:hypothetical protein